MRFSPVLESTRALRRCFWIVFALALLGRVWFAGSLPLTGDEAYHWEWSRHPALCYYDHPALTAWLIRGTTALLGHTERGVRLAAILSLAGAVLFARALARRLARLFGRNDTETERAALVMGLLLLFLPVYAMFGFYISTDPPLVLAWCASLYFMHRALEEQRLPLWVAAGVALGLAVMGKFLAFFLPMGLVLSLLISVEYRKRLATAGPYVCALVALTTASPVLAWNATHAWATFMFNFFYRQQGLAHSPLHLPEYVLVQLLLVLTPGVAIATLCATGRLAGLWKRERHRIALYLLCQGLPILLYFLAKSFSRRIGLHWPLCGWVAPLLAVAVFWDSPAWSEPRFKRFLRAGLGFAIGFTLLVHAAAHTPHAWVSRLDWKYRKDPERINIHKDAERYGWREMGHWVAANRNEILNTQKDDPRGVFIMCTQYGMAASVAFYTPGQPATHLWAPAGVHGQNYRWWDNYRALRGQDAILVVKRQRNAEAALSRLRRHFVHVAEPDALPIRVGADVVRTFYLVRCYRFNGIPPAFAEPVPEQIPDTPAH